MKSNTSNRRGFIKNASFGILGASLTNSNRIHDGLTTLDPDPPGIKAYRKLGRTGFEVSDIGCGPAVISHENVLKAILDAGVNFIDSAIAYGKKNEVMIGNAIKDYDRESLFISSKYHVKEDTTKEDVIAQFRGILERMKTDYLDCLQMHMVSSSKDLQNGAFHEATGQLKTEGRLRHIGVSCHGSNWFQDPEESMEDILSNAIEDGRFDLLLLVYNFVQQDMGKRILEKCRKNDLGTALMKTDPFGGFSLSLIEQYDQLKNEGKAIPGYIEDIHHKIFERQKMGKSFIEEHKLEDNDAINKAAIHFVLSNEDAHSILITFRNYNDIDKYINLSGTKLSAREEALLDHYRNSMGRYYCRHACGLCESSCPEKLPINTIMRYNHYFMAQDRQKYAIEKFYGLPRRDLNQCRNCEGFCEKNCPYGVYIRNLLSVAEQNLMLNV
jgi:predicted aldo/keto reductase-like oxidoreductase